MDENVPASPVGNEHGPVRRGVGRFLRWLFTSKWYLLVSGAIMPISSLIAIVLGARDLGHLHGPGWAKVLAWFAAGVTTVVIGGLYVEQARHRLHIDKLNLEHRIAVREIDLEHGEQVKTLLRKARLYDCQPQMHRIFHTLRDANAIVALNPEANNDEQIFRHLGDVLADLATLFSTLTGVACRSSIKSVEVLPESHAVHHTSDTEEFRSLMVKTLARHDGPVGDEPQLHLDQNSDFVQLLTMPAAQDQAVFLSNDLDLEPHDYSNPHRDRHPDHKNPYNATIVWPIQKRAVGGEESFGLVGFLCVDTLGRGVFVKDHDFHIGAAVADSLFTLIWRWRTQQG